MDEAKEQVLYGLAHCHILKISDNEIQWLTGGRRLYCRGKLDQRKISDSVGFLYLWGKKEVVHTITERW